MLDTLNSGRIKDDTEHTIWIGATLGARNEVAKARWMYASGRQREDDIDDADRRGGVMGQVR